MLIAHRFTGFISIFLLTAIIALIPGVRAGTPGEPLIFLEKPPNRSKEKVWLFFTDHGEADRAELGRMLDGVQIDEQALRRRTRRSRASEATAHDLPVNDRYVDAVRELGGEVHHRSRYFNAVSAWVTPEQLRAIERLPFVSRTERVKTGVRKLPPVETRDLDNLRKSPRLDDGIDYGLSDRQHNMINTKQLHAEGITGQGVRIAVFDTGFFRAHSALSHLDVIAEWDFINDDGNTADEHPDEASQMDHGTLSLGILASYWPGWTMGVAWDAEYILAKTEDVFREVIQEEDNYIAALEWADGLGADIVSSSLGYFYWYDQEDMDGDTALITRAVDIAASRGLLVVTAAGNEAGTAWGTLIAPADADSAIAVGAVDTSGVIMSYSSRGPTQDGRIKPDVVAQGQRVVTLNPRNPNGPAAAGGTSAATPLVAGAAALMLQKHPDWSPIQVRDALRATASRADHPDNRYGWGIINAYAAVNYAPSVAVEVDIRPGECDNPFNPKSRGVLPVLLLGSEELDVHAIDVTTLSLSGGSSLRAHVVDMAGEGDCSSPSPDGWDDLLVKFDVAGIAASMVPATKAGAVTLVLGGELNDGTLIEGEATVLIVGNQDRPARFGAAQTPVATGLGAAQTPVATGLGAAVPNPFNPITRIPYTVAGPMRVEIAVFDVRGRRVATLIDGIRPAGEHAVEWDATAQSSGVYFYRMRADGRITTRKLLLLK